MNNSLFLRLYLSITAVIVASILLVGLALEIYHNESSEADFVADIAQVAQQLSGYEGQALQTRIELLQQLSNFNIRILTTQQKQQFIQSHFLLDELEGYLVYELEDGRLAGLRDDLLISDSVQDSVTQAVQENIEFLLLLAFMFSAIALVLYLSVKRMSIQVNRLSEASRSLAVGDLDARVDERIPSPLKQMAQSFNHMAGSLQQAQQQQQAMANAIAHELRTPLTRIQLALGILNDHKHDDFTAQLHQDITRYAVEMEALADDTLTLQRLDYESDVLTESFRVDKLIETSVADIELLYPEQSVSLHLSEVNVEHNLRYLKLIIDNLISNACKYANKQVQVALTQADGLCVLSVVDDGEGISEQQRQQILAPFTRLDNSRSRATGGFGLGLAIVNTVIKKMNAQLDISDSSLGGAAFIVSFKAYQK